MNDFDKKHSVLAYHLKIWADDYDNFIAESKNGALTPDFDVLVITSNWHPSAIWET